MMKFFFFLSAFSVLAIPLLNKVDKAWIGMFIAIVSFFLALFFSKPRFTKGK
ncbi:hypothetical protein [Bacillus massilinigeriensis]|uniref:hypothetical protein n=1 Tax=Bacillus mediterraneensis TaxID=1805474 RepID=UPI001356483A|nr:hypothetical protein [Bacillus mediterraneensis]